MKRYVCALGVIISFISFIHANTIHANNLIDAIESGNIASVEQLLKQGADVTVRNEADLDIISLTIVSFTLIQQPDKIKHVIDLLLQAGADINAICNVYDGGFEAPIHIAILFLDSDLVDYLIKSGADVNIQPNNSSMTPLQKAVFMTCFLRSPDRAQQEELYNKVYRIVEILLRNGANRGAVVADEDMNKKVTAKELLVNCSENKQDVSEGLKKLIVLLEEEK